MSDKNKRTAYEVLGIPPSATGDMIKAAFRELSKEYHPDKHPGSFDEMTRKMQTIVGSYLDLGKGSDMEKRSKYDKGLTQEELKRSYRTTEGTKNNDKQPEKNMSEEEEKSFWQWIVDGPWHGPDYYEDGEERNNQSSRNKDGSKKWRENLDPFWIKAKKWFEKTFADEIKYTSEGISKPRTEGNFRGVNNYQGHGLGQQKQMRVIGKNNQEFDRELQPGEIRISSIELDLLAALDLAGKSKNEYVGQIVVNEGLTYLVRGNGGRSTISPRFKTKDGGYVTVDDGKMADMRLKLRQRGVDVPISMKDYFESLKEIANTINTSPEKTDYLPPDKAMQTINSFISLNEGVYSERRPYTIYVRDLPKKIMDREERMLVDETRPRQEWQPNLIKRQGSPFGGHKEMFG